MMLSVVGICRYGPRVTVAAYTLPANSSDTAAIVTLWMALIASPLSWSRPVRSGYAGDRRAHWLPDCGAAPVWLRSVAARARVRRPLRPCVQRAAECRRAGRSRLRWWVSAAGGGRAVSAPGHTVAARRRDRWR